MKTLTWKQCREQRERLIETHETPTADSFELFTSAILAANTNAFELVLWDKDTGGVYLLDCVATFLIQHQAARRLWPTIDQSWPKQMKVTIGRHSSRNAADAAVDFFDVAWCQVWRAVHDVQLADDTKITNKLGVSLHTALLARFNANRIPTDWAAARALRDEIACLISAEFEQLNPADVERWRKLRGIELFNSGMEWRSVTELLYPGIEVDDALVNSTKAAIKYFAKKAKLKIRTGKPGMRRLV